jgi:hypothetical protein
MFDASTASRRKLKSQFQPFNCRQQDAEKRCGPWFDKLTMRFKPLKSLHLIPSLSKDEAGISAFFSRLLE